MADDDTVPNGTIPEVWAWVGDDLDRAEAALVHEAAHKNRKGLTTELAERLDTAVVRCRPPLISTDELGKEVHLAYPAARIMADAGLVEILGEAEV